MPPAPTATADATAKATVIGLCDSMSATADAARSMFMVGGISPLSAMSKLADSIADLLVSAELLTA
jgi:hypothetical protein